MYFNDISTLKNKKEEKEFKSKVNQIIKIIKILLDFSEIIDEKLHIEKNKIDNMLLKLGIIKKIDQKAELEKLLKKDYITLNFVLEEYLKKLTKGEEIIVNELNKFADYSREQEKNKYLENKDSPRLIDLFCGSGGLSYGFKRAGFKILLANDIEPVCTETYTFNHPEIPNSNIITGDIREKIYEINNLIKDEIDVIVGGPPCQGFSMANRQRIINDPRNELYKFFVELIELKKPKIFVMENVKGMLKVAEQVKEDFHSLKSVDYEVEYKILNAKDYSVPQNRERLFYFGIRKDLQISPKIIIDKLEKIKEKNKSFVLKDGLDFLKQLKALEIKNATEYEEEKTGYLIDKNKFYNSTNEYIDLINQNKKQKIVFNHKSRYNNERDIEIYSLMEQGNKSDDEKIKHIMPYVNRSHIFKDKYYKLIENNVSKTITAHMKFDCNMYIHPNQARGLTPREAARVQSYPDDYFFLGSYTKTYMQIGNSVPPLLAYNIAKIIKEYLKRTNIES